MPTSVREYAILYVGGRKTIGAGSAGGGNVLLSVGQHAIDGAEHTGALDLDDLSDVDVLTAPPTDQQALLFNLGAGLWKPGTVSTGGGGAAGAMGPPGTDGEEGGQGIPGLTGPAGASATGSLFTVNVPVDGGGLPLTAGLAIWFQTPIAGLITQVELAADATGSIVVDIWRDTYASLPATVADTITAAAKPTLSAARFYKDTTLTGWSKTVSVDDWFYVNIDSVSGLATVVLALTIQRS